MASMFTADIREIASRSVLCWLATTDEKGQANVSPKEVWAIADDEHIVVANIASPCSARNIAVNPLVCLSFIDIFVQKGFKVIGTATEWKPCSPGYAGWAAPLNARVGDRFPIHSVFVIRAVEIHPIIAPSYILFPSETTEASQTRAALQTYGVRRAN
ncbi:pyridoxamine 5'-phosphate oxidase family protein [Azovibrio restrictus]|uniref:pyridoxamine 5'-phosphate oxidase family protein n=1 Tax=Azovibrio restrictus TaxID=146938 RepID=UPI0026F08BD5|nr:pyridoxamine 5'-phosphate oxidase family protein [Azovibrio restrictus]